MVNNWNNSKFALLQLRPKTVLDFFISVCFIMFGLLSVYSKIIKWKLNKWRWKENESELVVLNKRKTVIEKTNPFNPRVSFSLMCKSRDSFSYALPLNNPAIASINCLEGYGINAYMRISTVYRIGLITQAK